MTAQTGIIMARRIFKILLIAVTGVLFLILLLVVFGAAVLSCGSNQIELDEKTATVSSPDNYAITTLTLWCDSTHRDYKIKVRKGSRGRTSMNLNDIDEAYTILEYRIPEAESEILPDKHKPAHIFKPTGKSPFTPEYDTIPNKNFRLLPNTQYYIENRSEPDAASNQIQFRTDSTAAITIIESWQK